MEFVSTRNNKNVVNAEAAIVKGLSSDGGLFTPNKFDKIINVDELKNMNYKELAYFIITYFFDTLDKEKIKNAINNAYDKFDADERARKLTPTNAITLASDVTPTCKVSMKNKIDYYLELFHGPTSAFKDVALTMLPHLLTISYDKLNIDKLVYILCATSGDTGKSALEGFKDVKNTYITVFYPNNFVSKIQELQMKTTTGGNTNVVSVNGNFDDCQRIVKNLMKDSDDILKNKNVLFSSANSINIGRLIPQVVYYIKSYIDLLNNNEIKNNEKINFVVPTGNFGDILAGYIAKKMGLPIDKLICASNKNNILTDFLNTGVYDAKRTFYNTNSPSMDIIISSNLERLLYIESGYDDEFIKKIYKDLETDKKFEIEKNLLNKINETFLGFSADENETNDIIKKVFDESKYLIDTHTAVAKCCKDKFENKKINENKTVILSTASPYKFCKSVYGAVEAATEDVGAATCRTGKQNASPTNDEFSIMSALEKISNTSAPKNLKVLNELPILHKDNVDVEEAENYIAINKLNVL